jgi:hypothetical protein
MVAAAASRIAEALGLADDASTALAYVVRGAVVGGAVAVAVGGVDRSVVEGQLLGLVTSVSGVRR